jgi:diguanylate cyclase (GGDEF)-like protein/PAS domain S-box-containing protein
LGATTDAGGDLQAELDVLRRRLDRERRSRREAETIAERATSELYETVKELRASQAELDTTAALVALLQRATVAANEAGEVEGAARIALHEVCRFTGWPVGHLYVVEPPDRVVPTGVWHIADEERYHEFRMVTEASVMHVGEGLPGRVAASGQPAWITDVTTDTNFPRARSCENIGVKGAFAFPVIVDDGVVAVLEFFAPEAAARNEPLLRVMANVGTQLGRVVERSAARAQLEESEHQHRIVIETANDAFIAIDEHSTIVDWNHQAEQTFGWTRAEALGRSVADTIIPPTHKHAHALGLAHFIATGEGPVLGRRVELTALHRDGYEFPIELTTWAVRSGETWRFNAFVHDISERKAFEHQLEHQALHDPLTGLPNRALFVDRLKHALARSQRDKTATAVLFIDLDRFKAVNDSLGHEAGDRLLLAVAARIPVGLRAGDTLARLGGDEFVALCEDLDGEEDAIAVAQRILASLSGPFTLPGGEVSVSASIGIAVAQSDCIDHEQLLADADLAMYRAKERGRGVWELYDEAFRIRLVERLAAEKALRTAVDDGSLLVHYQPIIESQTGAVVGAEALLRWPRVDKGLVPAKEFVPLAEECGLITALGDLVLRDTCAQLGQWTGPAHTGNGVVRPVCAVNLSIRQLEHPTFTRDFVSTLAEHGIEPDQLMLEVTESVLMHDARVMIRRLWELHDIGVRFAIDDFGTGYSSLDRLRRMPVEVLKIDKSFIDDIDISPAGTPLVAAIIAMAHSLGLKVVAEGVERPNQFHALRRLGCDQMQGFLVSEPLTPFGMTAAVNGPGHLATDLLANATDHAPLEAVEAKLMTVVCEAMRGQGNIEGTTRSLLAELERLIRLDGGL